MEYSKLLKVAASLINWERKRTAGRLARTLPTEIAAEQNNCQLYLGLHSMIYSRPRFISRLSSVGGNHAISSLFSSNIFQEK